MARALFHQGRNSGGVPCVGRVSGNLYHGARGSRVGFEVKYAHAHSTRFDNNARPKSQSRCVRERVRVAAKSPVMTSDGRWCFDAFGNNSEKLKKRLVKLKNVPKGPPTCRCYNLKVLLTFLLTNCLSNV